MKLSCNDIYQHVLQITYISLISELNSRILSFYKIANLYYFIKSWQISTAMNLYQTFIYMDQRLMEPNQYYHQLNMVHTQTLVDLEFYVQTVWIHFVVNSLHCFCKLDILVDWLSGDGSKHNYMYINDICCDITNFEDIIRIID